MLGRTRKHRIDDMVTLSFRVHKANVDRIKGFVSAIEGEKEGESRPWREVIAELRPAEDISCSILRGSRAKEALTQIQLSSLTGIPRRHISEMENGKRPIGKETAKKLAHALNCDYRLFL